jgi:hypothetical protein
MSSAEYSAVSGTIYGLLFLFTSFSFGQAKKKKGEVVIYTFRQFK